jgi:hypothetical protein
MMQHDVLHSSVFSMLMIREPNRQLTFTEQLKKLCKTLSREPLFLVLRVLNTYYDVIGGEIDAIDARIFNLIEQVFDIWSNQLLADSHVTANLCDQVTHRRV